MAKKTYDWKGFDPKTAKAGVVPGMAGYNFVKLPAVAATPGTPAGTSFGQALNAVLTASPNGTGATRQQTQPVTPATPGTPGRAAGWYIKGPDGKLHAVGEKVSGNVSTGKNTDGFGADFFNGIRKDVSDYYMPQVARQYGEARDKTTYALANAGTLNSSVATDETAKLAEQNRLNRADVLAQGDSAAADARSRLATERAKAEGQLYATENPTLASNQALAAVKDIRLDQPKMSPLSEIFKIAAIGGANALGGYQSETAKRNFLKQTGTTITGS
jgi:hypothetical protein